MMDDVIKVKKIDFSNFNSYLSFSRQLISPSGKIVVDLSEIEECNSSIICLLVDIQRECNKANCKVDFVFPDSATNPLTKLLALYNLNNFFTDHI